MEQHIYQIVVPGEDGITLNIYIESPENSEQELIDFIWQKYYDFQPDKSKYSAINLTKEPEKGNRNATHWHLAYRAKEYAERYQ